MSTAWRSEDGAVWGKGVVQTTTKGTVWAPRDPVVVVEAPIEAVTVVDALEAEGFPCHQCDKVAKSAAGLAAHARKAH